MGSPYAGANLFPTDFTIPDDGDPEDASSVNVALEALGDRTVFNKEAFDDYLENLSPRLRMIEFLSSGTYIPDADSRIVAAFVTGCGGGGGGGCGTIMPGTDDRWNAGGGGGGAALVQTVPVVIVPGTTYNVDIGAGGAAGSGNAATGGDGGDTVFRAGATVLAAFGGAQGGRGAVGGAYIGLYNLFAIGGVARAGTPSLTFGDVALGTRFDTTDAMWVLTALFMRMQPGQGGYGAGGSTNPGSAAGSPNPFGVFPGGVAGVQGTDTGDQRGGGGGGGGAAGPYGPGGYGGDGGDAGNNGFGGGHADTVPGGNANSGAGGGGSGSGGFASSQGLGGRGSGGRLRLMIVEESP